MQVSVETCDGLTRRLKVELPADEIEQEIEKRLQNYARTARMPGFRPGKVPLKMLRQRYGDSVLLEVFGEQVETSLPQAVAQAELRPAGRPEIEPEMDKQAGRYGYTAEFEVFPEFAVSELDGRSVKRPIVEVTDADIDETVARLRDQRKRWESVTRPVAQGDRVKADFEGRIDGEPFEGGSATDAAVEVGAGRFIPGFEDALDGATVDEERTVTTRFPDDYANESLAGREAEFMVRIKEIQEPVLPEVDADFVREFGVDDGDVDRFRADVRRNLERELVQRVKDRVKSQVMDALLEKNSVEVPNALITEEIETLRRQMRESLSGAQLELPDQLFADNARRRVTLGLLIGEVVKQQGLEVEPERVRAAVEDMASTYDDPKAFVDYYYADRKRLASVESVVLEDVVVEHLLAQTDLIDEPMSFSELMAS